MKPQISYSILILFCTGLFMYFPTERLIFVICQFVIQVWCSAIEYSLYDAPGPHIQNSMLYIEFSSLYHRSNSLAFLAFHFIMLENGECNSFLADDHLALDFTEDIKCITW